MQIVSSKEVCRGFPGGSVVKNPPAHAENPGDLDLIPGSGESPGGGYGNPFQYSGLEHAVGRGAWQATVHGVTVRRDWATERTLMQGSLWPKSESPDVTDVCIPFVVLVGPGYRRRWAGVDGIL